MVGLRYTLLFLSVLGVFMSLPQVGCAQTAPSFTSSPVLAGEYSTLYSYSIATDDVDASPREIILSSGILPSGVSLTDNGDGTALLQGSPEEAGSFSIELTVRETSSPFLESTQSFTLSVAKVMLTVKANNASRVYGQSNPALTFVVSGFVNGDDETDLDTAPVASTSATQASAVGNYSIVTSGGADGNYDFTYVNGTLSITKAALTATADNKSFVYGQSVPTLTITYSGFVNDDDALDLDTEPVAGTVATSSSNVGVYSITVSGGTDDNYSLSLVNGQLSITKAQLTVTADNKSKAYATANPLLTFSYAGFVTGDDEADLDVVPTIGTLANIGSDVGSYPITLAGGSDNNYSFQLVHAQLTIAKAFLTISVLNTSRLYGAFNPAFTLTYSGFVNGDDENGLDAVPIASTTATITSGTGTYPIIPSSGIDNNYTFVYVSGQLTVTKAPLTVTVANATKVYGHVNPSFTFSYSGFVNSENQTILDQEPTVSTAANTTSDAGTYAIVASGGLDDNYAFVYISGTFTITKAYASVSITSLLQNVNGLPRPVMVETVPSGLPVVVLYNGSTTIPSVKGTYSVQATINDTNYQGTSTASYLLNGAPEASSLPLVNMNEDGPNHVVDLSLYVEDTEQSDATLLYEIRNVSNAPIFSQSIIAGSVLTLSLNPNKYGSSSIVLRFTDAQGLFTENTLNVTVANVQDAPVFTSTPVLVAAQDVPYTYTIMATDVDLMDVLTITSNIALPSWLSLINHGNGTATLSGTPLEADIGVDGIALKVTDDKGNSANQFFNINILEGQFPPQFTSTPVTTARENTEYLYTVTTSDFNGGPITYTAITKPTWMSAAPNGSGGFVLSGKPSLTDVYDENGNVDFSVSIRATDNTGLSSLQNYSIRVLYENSPPTLSLASTQVTIDEDSAPVDFPLTGITDGGEIGQVISITTTANPASKLSASVDYQSPQTTGMLRLHPSADANGAVIVSIRVQDNGKSSKNFVVKSLSVTINPVNDKPSITSTPVARANVGGTYFYSIKAADPDADDDLTFELVQEPSWLQVSTVSNREGLVSGNVPLTASDEVVRIRVKDEAGETVEQMFTLVANKPPVLQNAAIETTEDVAVALGKSFFQPLISDPNADTPVKIKVVQLPAGKLQLGSKLIALNEEILWNDVEQLVYTPALDYFGADNFSWNSSDGLFYSDNSSQISITVLTANDPPELRNLETLPIAYSQGDVGIVISSQVTIVDVDDVNLVKATIAVADFYDNESDELYYDPSTDNSSLSSTFNRETGVLTLEGEASKSVYENALRNVKYRSNFLGETYRLTRTVALQAYDLTSASNTVQRSILITRVLPDIELVEAFTPNGDGINEVWDFKNLAAYNDVNIVIYDSSGRAVFNCSDSTCAWDGRFKGTLLPAGPYLYTIDLDKGRRTYKGTVTLLR
jgi:gliding motility-associated-like protein